MGIIRTENAKIAWRKEASWGAAGSGNYHRFGTFESLNAPDPEYEWYPFFGVFAGRSRDRIFRGKQTLRGSIPDIRLQGDNVTIFEMMTGRYSGSYYAEGISMTDETIPSFEMGVDLLDTDGVCQLRRIYKGGLVNRWTLAANEGEELRLSLDEMLFKDMIHNLSGHAKYSASAAPSFTVDSPTAAGRFTFAECQITMFGLVFTHIRRFSLTCDQQIEMRYYLQRGGSSDYQQVPNGYVPGKRAYRLEIDLDMADPTIDRDVWEWLVDQAAASWPGFTLGTQIAFDFVQSGSGEGSDRLIMSCGGATGLSTAYPGAVITSATINHPAPPAGVPSVTVSFDVDDILIYAP